jgi:pyruvate/2-oxoglutarate dehydrogenase complex dihydrolipoamide dehydrogenase (E3) component
VLHTGRRADTSNLGLENIGVKTNPSNGKIVCQDEQTTCENVYAIGDVVDGAPELTPSAIHAGKLLARRLAGDKSAKMDYKVSTALIPSEMSLKADEVHIYCNILSAAKARIILPMRNRSCFDKY